VKEGGQSANDCDIVAVRKSRDSEELADCWGIAGNSTRMFKDEDETRTRGR
jgi:hypothetical protein